MPRGCALYAALELPPSQHLSFHCVRSNVAVENFKDLVVACKLLSEGAGPDVEVVYEAGRFIYKDRCRRPRHPCHAPRATPLA